MLVQNRVVVGSVLQTSTPFPRILKCIPVYHRPRTQKKIFYITRGPFHELGLTLIWINNNMLSKVRDDITYPFPDFNGARV